MAPAEVTVPTTNAATASATPVPDPSWTYLNPDLPVNQRVDDLIGRMTVDEKISQLMMSSSAIPRLSDADLPSFTDYSMANRTYRYFTGMPLYAFGYGLSYTTFNEDHLALSAAEAKRGDTLKLSVAVKNTGSRAGDDVVEVYARAVKPPVSMPQQWLVGFQRVALAPGETKTATIPVQVESLRRYDETLKGYVVDSGDYELHVGPSSDHLPLTATLKISK